MSPKEEMPKPVEVPIKDWDQKTFDKNACRYNREGLTEVMKAMPKKAAREFLGHFNDLFLFFEAAEKAAPGE